MPEGRGAAEKNPDLIRPHADRLKLARAARDIIAHAKANIIGAEHRNELVSASVRRHLAVLDEYLAAVNVLEGVSLDMLAALGADATPTNPSDATTD